MRQIILFTKDHNYQQLLAIAKGLSYVEKIETDENDQSTTIDINQWQPNEDLKKTLDKALLQDKSTFKTLEEINGKFKL